MNILVNKLPSPLPDNTYVGVDIEMWGMDKNQLHRPNSGRLACLTIATDNNTVYLIDDENIIDLALGSIDNCIWCIHNSSFDITQLRRYSNIPPRNKLWDTLLMERVLWNGLYSGYALDDTVRRYLDEKVDKSLQTSFTKDTGEPMSNEQARYAAKDAIDHLRVAKAQKPHVNKTLFNIYKNVDLAAQWAILDFRGFRIDVDKWLELYNYHIEKQQAIDDKLEFNPRSKGSTGQVSEYCKEHFDIELESVAKKYLQKQIKKYSKNKEFVRLIEKVIASNDLSKQASTYGENFISKHVEYIDGLAYIFANFDPSRAKTGRMASSDPNMQNIPIRGTTAFRNCFIPSPGHKLIIADFSSQEPRITAYLTKDPKLIQFFKEGGDPYIRMGEEFYGKTIAKSSPERDMMKILFLALIYGLTEYGLRREHGLPLKEGKEFLARASQIFPTAYNVMLEMGEERVCAHTLLGRPVWLNPYPESGHAASRLARNAPVQGTAAEQMKLVLHRLYVHQMKKYGEYFVVAPVHDEAVSDVPDELVSEVKKEVEDTMVQVAEEICPGVPFKAEAIVANSWAEKG